jgi:hypothetical protein
LSGDKAINRTRFCNTDSLDRDFKITMSNLLNVLVKPGTIVHTCNSSYLGGRYQEYRIQGQSRQKVSEIGSQPTSWACL